MSEPQCRCDTGNYCRVHKTYRSKGPKTTSRQGLMRAKSQRCKGGSRLLRKHTPGAD